MAQPNASGEWRQPEQAEVNEETGTRVTGRPATVSSSDPGAALGGRAEVLLRRVRDIEKALAVQEWWLLGRVLPEARVLAEVASLLAVARGELESALSNYFKIEIEQAGQTDQLAAVEGAAPGDTNDAAWVAASRDQALGLLRMVAAALAPMLQYAQMLRTYGEQLGLPSGAVDAFGIVYDRLAEIDEALRQPPE
ncbi:MAG: hypothetical protein ACXWQR_17625 [Ktedonobacterales bacterium]